MELRTTQLMTVDQAIVNARQQSDRLNQLQAQAATGKRITVPSDDPAAIAPLLAAKRQDAQLGVYLGNIQSATTTLDASVAALRQASDVLTSARQIAIEGSQSGTSQQGIDALAAQVDRLIDQMLNAANSKNGDQYLFAGTAATSQPFSVATVNAQGQPQSIVYDGGADRAEVIIGPGKAAQTLYTGNEVFQKSGAYDAFQSLIDLRDALRNASGLTDTEQTAAIGKQIAELEKAQDGLLQNVGEQSAALQHLQDLSNNFQDLQLAARKWTTDLEGANITDVVVQLQQQQNQLQLTLASLARVMSVNLLDFLR